MSQITHRYVQNAIQSIESFLDEVNTSNLETQMIIQKDIEAGTFSFGLSYGPKEQGFIKLNINTKTSSSNFFKSSTRRVQGTALIKKDDQAVKEIMKLVLLEMGLTSEEMRKIILLGV